MCGCSVAIPCHRHARLFGRLQCHRPVGRYQCLFYCRACEARRSHRPRTRPSVDNGEHHRKTPTREQCRKAPSGLPKTRPDNAGWANPIFRITKRRMVPTTPIPRWRSPSTMPTQPPRPEFGTGGTKTSTAAHRLTAPKHLNRSFVATPKET